MIGIATRPRATTLSSSGNHPRMRLAYFGAMEIPIELLIGLLACAALPMGINATTMPFGSEFGATERTFIATSIAYLFVWYCGRRLDVFPSSSFVDHASYLTPIVAIAYATIAFALLALRLDYSRVQLFGSGLLTLVLSLLAARCRAKFFIRTYAVNPSSLLDVMPKVPACRWMSFDDALGAAARINAIVTDFGTRLSEHELSELTRSAIAGVPVLDRRTIIESLTGRTPLSDLNPNQFAGLLPSRQYLSFRRAIELVATLALLPIFLPVALAIAVAIRLDSEGPVLFTQLRVGQRGQVFRIFKFRTMHHGNSGSDYTTHDDPRITRVGTILRRYHLDEIPQFLNVLLGQMSWVGPRPEAKELHHIYAQTIPHFTFRGIARPGITGWAQINQGYAHTPDEMRTKLEYDLYYLRHCSLWLDVLIVLRTLAILPSGAGTR